MEYRRLWLKGALARSPFYCQRLPLQRLASARPEFGYMAKVKPDFDRRGVKIIGLSVEHKVATPVNWRQGEDVIIAGSVSDDEAKQTYPDGWESPRPYIRIVPQPD